MQNTSETWKSLAAMEGTYVESRATINNTEYSDIEPPVVTRALMQNGLEVGNVVSATCTFTIDTINVIPKSAEVLIEARLVGSVNGQTVYSEWLPQGTFFIAKRVRDPITGMRQFECYDALLKTNAVWEPASSTWPQQTENILDEILLVIGLELDARTSITSYPISQPNAGTTMRDVLSVIAQQNGGNWIVTPNNKLRLVPIQDLNDAGEDVAEIESVIGEYYIGETNEISGIRVMSEDGDSLIGDETGAVVSVTIPEMIAVDLSEELIGKTYRPFSFGNAGYDIAAELGDYIQCEDAVSVIYAETITLGTTMHGDISAPDLAEIVDEYPYVGSSDKTLVAAKAYAKEYADNAIGEYDDDMTQQEIFNRLTDNGAAQGMILHNGQLYINAGYINAGEFNAAIVRIRNLSVSDISSGIIHSADYETIAIAMIYPLSTLYPSTTTFANRGEYVTSGFAIDFRTGQIYGGFYSSRIAALQQAVQDLQDAVSTMQSALVYPKSIPTMLAPYAFTSMGTRLDNANKTSIEKEDDE